MAEVRIYRIGDALVRAKSPQQAVVHHIKRLRCELKATLATQDEIFKLAKAGAEIHDAVDEPQTDLPLEPGEQT